MAKSITKNNTGFSGSLGGYKTYKTTISDGRHSVTGHGITPEKSQKVASEKRKK